MRSVNQNDPKKFDTHALWSSNFFLAFPKFYTQFPFSNFCEKRFRRRRKNSRLPPVYFLYRFPTLLKVRYRKKGF